MANKTRPTPISCDWFYCVRRHGETCWSWEGNYGGVRQTGVTTTEQAAVNAARRAVEELSDGIQSQRWELGGNTPADQAANQEKLQAELQARTDAGLASEKKEG